MENLTQEVTDKVNELWESNSKIPFMQAKDILCLGYTCGARDAIAKCQSVVQQKQDTKDNSFVGTSKELIKEADKRIEESKQDSQKDKYKIEHEEKTKTLNTQIQLTGEILNFMAVNMNFIDVYTHIKELNKKYQDELFYEQTNHGEYKSKRYMP